MIFYVVFLSTLRKHCEVHHELRETTVSIPRDFHSPVAGSYQVKGFLCFMIRHFHCLSLSLYLTRVESVPLFFLVLSKTPVHQSFRHSLPPWSTNVSFLKGSFYQDTKGTHKREQQLRPQRVCVLCPRRDTTPLRFCFNALSHSLSLRSRFMGLLPPSLSLSPSLSLW